MLLPGAEALAAHEDCRLTNRGPFSYAGMVFPVAEVDCDTSKQSIQMQVALDMHGSEVATATRTCRKTAAGPTRSPSFGPCRSLEGESTLLIGPGEGIDDAGNGSMSPDGSLVTFLGGGYPTSGEVGHCGPCRLVANADGTVRRVIAGWMATPASPSARPALR